MSSISRIAVAAVLSSFVCGAAVAADSYPTRSVRMIVPFAPGGASDHVARIIQPAMAELLGQQVVVDNRPGAAGNIGVETAARATADGHTFLLGNVGTMAINPVYYTKFQYKPLKDLIPITQVVDVPGSLVVNPTLQAKTVKELVAYLKANPGKLNYGSPAPSSANNLEMIMFLNLTGTSAVGVPYKGGAGPANIGLLANEVQMMFVTFSSALPHVKNNRMRMLGVISPERNPALSEIPTMREQGFDMAVGSWQGLFVPAGTPRPVVSKLQQVGLAAMKNATVQKRLADGGVSIVTSKSSEEFVKFVKSETERFGKVIRDAKIATD
ncbi:MAG: tripartite tricarboxylate transporter substrate binding protein [Betaproteobacteria bacterium]|jgi:tripartite-type tricarboxylate transporter receptor subunit TctC|nr:tripartite tricarboxylate transporter substrate binding protein [Betaproteobacteria bacterium]MDH5342669.1 tripartite tricarboxylate transporter substrate binding protein [Betaproteobacteria bacterium]